MIGRWRGLLPIPLVVLAALAFSAPAAGATDRVYWANFASDEISYANLDGSGGTVDLDTTGATVNEPIGLTLDPAGGRVYWTNHTGSKISYADLGGGGGGDLNVSGVPVSNPIGLSIDPVAGRIYWANEGANKLAYANLDGSGGAELNTTGATVNAPAGVAFDPVSDRVYWTNFSGPSISYANADGSGGKDLAITGSATLDTPLGIAVDPVAGRIYWANDNAHTISSANLDGSGAVDLNTTGATVAQPYGIAVDPLLGRVYWGNTSGGKISFARLDGSGGADLPSGGTPLSGSNFPALLMDPHGLTPPTIAGRIKIGSALSCSLGSWAGDLASGFLYRAPLGFAYQWSRNGGDIAGANAVGYTPLGVGEYRCGVMASNRAGLASQTSALAAVFKVGKAKLNRRKGTAQLPVSLPGAGTLSVTGKGIVTPGPRRGKKPLRASSSITRTVSAAGTVRVPIKAKGKKRKRLNAKGKVRARVTVTFTPTTGFGGSETKPITLHKKRAPRR